jgi:hypothetical protein
VGVAGQRGLRLLDAAGQLVGEWPIFDNAAGFMAPERVDLLADDTLVAAATEHGAQPRLLVARLGAPLQVLPARLEGTAVSAVGFARARSAMLWQSTSGLFEQAVADGTVRPFAPEVRVGSRERAVVSPDARWLAVLGPSSVRVYALDPGEIAGR